MHTQEIIGTNYSSDVCSVMPPEKALKMDV